MSCYEFEVVVLLFCGLKLQEMMRMIMEEVIDPSSWYVPELSSLLLKRRMAR